MNKLLETFVNNWASNYELALNKLDIFSKKELNWTLDKKQKFILLIHHFRGNFYHFLWYVGSLSPNKEFKDIVLQNITEEFNGKAPSHDQLYMQFAREFGIDTTKEILSEANYHDFARKFNRGHLKFVLTKPWNQIWSAFSSFERLDNIDYKLLLGLAQKLGTSKNGLVFFKVHTVVQHFESTSKLLEEIWEKDPQSVKKGFEFIAQNQLEMWRELGKELNT